MARGLAGGILACFLSLVPLSFLMGIGYLTVFDSAILEIAPPAFLPFVAWLLLAGTIAAFFALPLYGLPIYLLLKRIGQNNWWMVAFAWALPGLMLRFFIDQQNVEIAYVAVTYGTALGIVFSLAVSRNSVVSPSVSGAVGRHRTPFSSTSFLYAYFVLVVSVSLTLATLAVDSRVESEHGLAAVALGHPIPFLSQNRSMLDPPSWPQYYSLGAPQEFPTELNVLSFLADTAIFAVAIGLPLLIVKIAKSRPQY